MSNGHLNIRELEASSRASRADQYFEQDLRHQLLWYDARSTAYKRNAQSLAFLVIAAGSITTFVQVFGQAPWVSIITAGLGALVVFAEGWQRIARYNETWASYRSAAEGMKREKRLFVNGAGSYRTLNDEDAYLQFVENVEAIMSEEQQLFWRNRRSESSGQSSAGSAAVAEKR